MTNARPLPTNPDPTLGVAERELALLTELAEMAMVVSRAYASASVAAAYAVEVTLADEKWHPETARARALAGAKDAAESFQKVSRALRLTLMLQKSAAEAVRDLRAGVVPQQRASTTLNQETIPPNPTVQEKHDRDVSDKQASDERRSPDRERLVERERLDQVLSGPFRQTVDRLCVDIGATIDWKSAKVGRPDLSYQSLKPMPADAAGGQTFGSITLSPKPPSFIRRRNPPGPADPEAALPSPRTATIPS